MLSCVSKQVKRGLQITVKIQLQHLHAPTDAQDRTLSFHKCVDEGKFLQILKTDIIGRKYIGCLPIVKGKGIDPARQQQSVTARRLFHSMPAGDDRV